MHHFNFNDHYNFKAADLNQIHNLFDKFAKDDPVIITTEKDAMRLMTPEFEKVMVNYPWACQSIEVVIDNASDFNLIVKQYVEENS